MTQPEKTTAAEQTEYIATEIMGWKNFGKWDAWRASKAKGGERINGQWVKLKRDFRPLTNWNHWRQVEEEVLEDEYLQRCFIGEVCQATERKDFDDSIVELYMLADLPTRVSALIAAHKELYEQ